MSTFLSLLYLALLPTIIVTTANPDVTVYTGQATATTSAAADSTYTGLPAYDPTVLTPPPAPQPPINSYTLALPASAADLGSNYSLSIPQKGNFLGFSIELSVANTVLGEKGNELKVPFLNYMANIRDRAGAGPIIRVGGNSQEGSTIFADGLEDGESLDKIKVSDDVTATPIINYSPELLYTMANISTLLDVEWFFGLAFNETSVDGNDVNIPVAAEWAQKILGSNLRGLAVGNEPDLYVDHSARPAGWGVSDYVNEYKTVVDTIVNANVLSNSQTFIGPSVCCQREGFELDDVIAASWLSDNQDRLAAVTVQHYPTNNCDGTIQAQDIFADFLNHTSAESLTSLYLSNSAELQAAGKELIMLEMNTASCGGFPGLSDSFGAAMWMTDWALQLAWANFSAALMHVGGQNVYYNPFLPPPSSMAKVYQWTTGSVYYSTLVIAEVFGSSNKSQVVDLQVDDANIYHPAYAIYEDGQPTRVVLFNYINDPTGASQLTVNIASSAFSVSVRYLSAPTVSEQYNITWAGQTLGVSFSSDGRLYGTEQTSVVQCTDGNCPIEVSAPSIAVVYLTDQALADSSVPQDATSTYATTVVGHGSATVEAGALSTGNGQNAPSGVSGSTSEGSTSGSLRQYCTPSLWAALGLVIWLFPVAVR
ncbi:hypothetical protein TREMEDRAFT_41693 [Tremella mesenterica DSM 1558]|uniref:uncharacterized protein n=1 Tax=Tremella mesenterica (strain ATCC 24925 / CBS 8224 / DSM 1558 / NBRC 9311 / NRRL Y-6157 / RJB 2259-6 / UBC 559-6) TaxID=578456 RepID=UPI0003F4A407|nr:uncharacterized protein TREMEDRAFT_41693 [Tremella mesenterica DSM 1558]EIW72362.1 hypothetical protein TREMEDRAFT_41693 [Tremella mesenterica DSM 1558]